jgi:hypothetical protein
VLPFIDVSCPCGRTLRARVEQGGATIHCWDCGRTVPVPHQRLGKGRLARTFRDAAGRAVRPSAVLPLVGGAALLTAVLLVPRAGPWLALGVLAAAAWGYEGLIARTGLEPEPVPPPLPGREEPAVVDLSRPVPGPPPDRAANRVGVRVALAVAASVLLVAPQLVRNAGRTLPPEGYRFAPGVFGTMALAFAAGWLVMPLVVLLAHAHDRRGPLPVRLTLSALARHPLATIAAVLVAPLGLAAIEAALAGIAAYEGYLPVLVGDLFPPPRVETDGSGTHYYFDYDGETIVADYLLVDAAYYRAYPKGLRHGYTLTGTLPASLAEGSRARTWMRKYYLFLVPYLAVRIALTFLILTGLGLLMSVQARWLGAIASLDSRRPPALDAAPGAGRPTPLPSGT